MPRLLGPAIAAAVALLYALVLLARGHPYDVDRVTQFLPYAQAGLDAWGRGELPLWTDGIWNGYPLLAEGQGGFLSPVKLTWLFCSDAVSALDAELVVSLVLAALSGSLAARLLGAGHAGSALAGIAWALGGGIVAYHDNPAVVLTCLSMPLAFALALRAKPLTLGAVLGFAILGGHPYFYALTLVLSGVGWLCAKRRGSWAQHLGWGAAALGLGLALGAAQWIPSAELTLHSDRAAGLAPPASALAQLRPSSLAYLVWPFYSPSLRYSSDSGLLAYVGVFVLLLASYGVARVWILRSDDRSDAAERHWRLLGVVAAVSLVTALLASAAGERLADVPVLNMVRGPSKLLIPFGLALALLAARGLRELDSRIGRWALVALVALDLFAYGQLKADPIQRDALRTRPIVADLAGPDAHLITAGTQAVWGGEIPDAPEEQAAFLRARQPLDANCGLLFGVAHVDGYTPLRVARSVRFLNARGDAIAARLWRAGATHAVLPPGASVPWADRAQATAGRWALHPLPAPRPPVFLCTDPLVSDPAGAVEALASAKRHQVVLESQPSVKLDGRPAGEMRVVSRAPRRIEVALRLARPALVVIAVTHYPGWEATLNGQPVEILPADVAFQAVAVPAGEHSLVFRYRPASARVGLAISLGALIGLGVVVWLRRRRSGSMRAA